MTRDPALGASTPPAVELTGLTKLFGGTRALDDVSFAIPAGRITALVGENGAGKSTLLTILAGLQAPSAGRVQVFGEEVTSFDPHHLLTHHGVAIVPQELSLMEDRTIAENIFAGREPGSRLAPSRARMRTATGAALERVGLRRDPATRVAELDLPDKQLVVLARALAQECRILILDEPTALLTPAESATLYDLVERLRDAGTTVVYVSHRMPEVFRLSDTTVVLRDGRLVGTWTTADFTPDECVTAMVGRELATTIARRAGLEERLLAGEVSSRPMLEVSGLAGPRHHGIDLEVRAGEIVGVAGLPDSGRVEMLKNLFGDQRTRGTGAVRVDGTAYGHRSPDRSIRRRIAFIPGERKTQGLMPEMSVSDNIAALRVGAESVLGFRRIRRLRRTAETAGRDMDVRTASYEEPIGNLSGGNQQKAIIARWALIEPKLLIMDEPTRGIDVGAKAQIYDWLFRLSDGGAAVLCSSSDLQELLAICDRIVVLREGRVAAVLEAAQAGEEQIMRFATGADALEPRAKAS